MQCVVDGYSIRTDMTILTKGNKYAQPQYYIYTCDTDQGCFLSYEQIHTYIVVTKEEQVHQVSLNENQLVVKIVSLTQKFPRLQQNCTHLTFKGQEKGYFCSKPGFKGSKRLQYVYQYITKIFQTGHAVLWKIF